MNHESKKLDTPIPVTQKMEELFKNNDFIVPNYQRNYAWQNGEISDFWDDLSDIFNGYRDGHFFGQIVTYRNENHVQEIIDGQQRLTTSIIFQSVLRDIANEIRRNNVDKIAEDTQKKLIRIDSNSEEIICGEDGEANTLLVQKTSEDSRKDLRIFFQNLTKHKYGNDFSCDASSIPMKNMYNAYRQLKKSVEEELQKFSSIAERVDKLKKISDAFIKRFYVIMLSTESKRDAFIIFETLNSRGRDLAASDIIKNHIMYIVSDNIEPINKKWQYISAVLKDNSSRLTRFIKTYWAARNRLVPEAKLYKSLSGKITKKTDAFDFVNDLDELVSLYDMLENPTANKKNREFFQDKELMRLITILNKLGVKLYYPIMLAMSKKQYSESTMKQVLNMVLRVFVRHRTIIYEGTNTLEKGYANVAAKIYSEELVGSIEINNYMRETLYKNNKDVENAHLVLSKDLKTTGHKKWTLVYLLQEYYDYWKDSNGKLYQMTFVDDNYVPCHIKEENIDNDLINYVGNYTLIEKKLVNKLDKANTDLKRAQVMRESRLEINKQLAESLERGWSNEKIEERQAKMTAVTTKIW